VPDPANNSPWDEEDVELDDLETGSLSALFAERRRVAQDPASTLDFSDEPTSDDEAVYRPRPQFGSLAEEQSPPALVDSSVFDPLSDDDLHAAPPVQSELRIKLGQAADEPHEPQRRGLRARLAAARQSTAPTLPAEASPPANKRLSLREKMAQARAYDAEQTPPEPAVTGEHSSVFELPPDQPGPSANAPTSETSETLETPETSERPAVGDLQPPKFADDQVSESPDFTDDRDRTGAAFADATNEQDAPIFFEDDQQHSVFDHDEVEQRFATESEPERPRSGEDTTAAPVLIAEDSVLEAPAFDTPEVSADEDSASTTADEAPDEISSPAAQKMSLRDKLAQARAYDQRQTGDEPTAEEQLGEAPVAQRSWRDKLAEARARDRQTSETADEVDTETPSSQKMSWRDKLAQVRSGDHDLNDEQLEDAAAPVLNAEISPTEAAIAAAEESALLADQPPPSAPSDKKLSLRGKIAQARAYQAGQTPTETPVTAVDASRPRWGSSATEPSAPVFDTQATATGFIGGIRAKIAEARQAEVAGQLAGADVSPPGRLEQMRDRMRRNQPMAPATAAPSAFEQLLSPLAGPQLALLQQELEAEVPIFQQLQRGQNRAVLRQRTGLAAGLALLVVFAFDVRWHYLIHLLPHLKDPSFFPSTWAHGPTHTVIGGIFFGLGLLLPLLMVFAVTDAVAYAWRGIADVRIDDLVFAVLSGATAAVVFVSCAHGHPLTAAAVMLIWGLLRLIARRLIAWGDR
jgi:hypothetical protein